MPRSSNFSNVFQTINIGALSRVRLGSKVATVATHEQEYPELRRESGEVVQAAIHLLDEEMEIAERLERKGREQWQLVAFMAPLAIAGSLTAVSANGVGAVWVVAIGTASLVSLALLVWSMFAGSDMANTQEAEAINPDLLDGYLKHLNEDSGDQAEAQVRADLAQTLVGVSRSRHDANEVRRSKLKTAVFAARVTIVSSVLVLVLAAIAVMVNA